MTTKVGKTKVTTESGKRVEAKLATRSSAANYGKLSQQKRAIESKLERLSRETRNSSVQVLTNA